MRGRPARFWWSAIGTLIVADVWAAYNAVEGDSLSEVVRATFRTDTPAGRAAVVIGWTALTAWVIPHWCHTVHDAATT